MKTRALGMIGILALGLAAGGVVPPAEAQQPPNPWSFLQMGPQSGGGKTHRRGGRKGMRNPKGAKNSQLRQMRRLMRRSSKKKFKL